MCTSPTSQVQGMFVQALYFLLAPRGVFASGADLVYLATSTPVARTILHCQVRSALPLPGIHHLCSIQNIHGHKSVVAIIISYRIFLVFDKNKLAYSTENRVDNTSLMYIIK